VLISISKAIIKQQL